MDDIDLALDGFQPADDASDTAHEALWGGDLTPLAEHHTGPAASHSFYVAHDRSATWGIPGAPQLVAIKISRDPRERTFAMETSDHATYAFAQHWLVERGCPPEALGLVGDDAVKPADELTARIEEQIRTSGDRYQVIDTHTSDVDPAEAWTMVHDRQADQLRIRVFLEELQPDCTTYTMREGAFADPATARNWLNSRTDPLPEPPARVECRTRAALARSVHPAQATAPGSTPAASVPSSTSPQLAPRR